MLWNNTEYGFTGYNECVHASCNIEQNRIIIYRDDDPIEQIEIELESPMPVYNEVQLYGMFEGFNVFIINMTGNYEYDIKQLQSAIENFIIANIGEC